MADLLALAERCEKASGPDRELDEALYEALGAVRPGTCDLYWTAPDGSNRHYSSLIPRYTASLDAAMTLVPEGWIWNVSSTGQAWLDKGDHDLFYGDANTPALALCAAALRARHAIESAA